MARVVAAFWVVYRPVTSTLLSQSTLVRSAPKLSAPTFPMKAELAPSLAAATATLAGAPPGNADSIRVPSGAMSVCVRSMRISPRAAI